MVYSGRKERLPRSENFKYAIVNLKSETYFEGHMKSTFNICALICGTLLILTPIISNYLLTNRLADIIIAKGGPAHLNSSFENSYYDYTLILGIIMIIAGIIMERKDRKATFASQHSNGV